MKVITKPAALPVSASEAQDELRVEGDDAAIQRKLRDATARVEDFLSQKLITQQIQETYALPSARRSGVLGAYARVPRTVPLVWGPVQAVDTVEYQEDEGGAWLPFTSYYLADNALVLTLAPLGRRLRVTFTVGYGDAPTDVPERLRGAILAVTGALYDGQPLPDLAALVGDVREVDL